MSNQYLHGNLDGRWNWTPIAPGWRVASSPSATDSHTLVGWTDKGEPVICHKGQLKPWSIVMLQIDAPFVVWYLT